MKAIILAAGRGSRMGNKTETLPKCLTTLWGKTLLEHQLTAIKQAGIEEIAVVTGYKAEEICKHKPNLTYFHNENWANTNMVATLLKAESWLNSDTCHVSYADIIYESAAITALLNNTDNIALTYYTEFLQLWEKRFDNPLDDLETFKIDGNSYLKEIGQKPQTVNEVEVKLSILVDTFYTSKILIGVKQRSLLNKNIWTAFPLEAYLRWRSKS